MYFYHILEKGSRRNQEISFPAIQWRQECESKQAGGWCKLECWTSGIKWAVSGSSGQNRSPEVTFVAGTFQGERTDKWQRVLDCSWGGRNLDGHRELMIISFSCADTKTKTMITLEI